MPITLIAAAAGTKLVIGRDGDLPWHFSSDLKFFKEKTMGHPVVMGRKTYESILKRLGKPLPGRRNIVLTHDKNFRDERAEIIHDLAALDSLHSTDETLFVIGGDAVFRQTMPMADRILLTYIDQEIPGDAFFPAIDPDRWHLADERAETEKEVRLLFRTYALTH